MLKPEYVGFCHLFSPCHHRTECAPKYPLWLASRERSYDFPLPFCCPGDLYLVLHFPVDLLLPRRCVSGLLMSLHCSGDIMLPCCYVVIYWYHCIVILTPSDLYVVWATSLRRRVVQMISWRNTVASSWQALEADAPSLDSYALARWRKQADDVVLVEEASDTVLVVPAISRCCSRQHYVSFRCIIQAMFFLQY